MELGVLSWCTPCIPVPRMVPGPFQGVTLYLHQHKWCLRLGKNCCCLSALKFNGQCKISAQPDLEDAGFTPSWSCKRQQFIHFPGGFVFSDRNLFCNSIFNCSNPYHDFIICSPGKEMEMFSVCGLFVLVCFFLLGWVMAAEWNLIKSNMRPGKNFWKYGDSCTCYKHSV